MKTLRKLINKIFDPFWNLFYSLDCNKEKFEYSCFPFPFKINCIGCYGCIHNLNPLFSPPKSKGPWQVCTSELFNKQYAELFGKGALVELLYDLEKHNKSIEKC